MSKPASKVQAKGGNIKPKMRKGGADKFLEYYGYLKKRPEEEVTKAIQTFQKHVGLTITGEMDDDTVQKMSAPRCLHSDPATMTENAMAMAQKPKWNKLHLTYRIVKYTPDLHKQEVDDAVSRALKVWSDVTPLTFEKTSELSDIEMSFESHGKPPLHEPGGTLAYAYYPGPGKGGDVHFDENETWTVRSFRGINLFYVAAHELGHSLGLDHSDVQGSLMFPYYRGYKPDFKLHQDDIRRIQALYGKKPQERRRGSFPAVQKSKKVKLQ